MDKKNDSFIGIYLKVRLLLQYTTNTIVTSNVMSPILLCCHMKPEIDVDGMTIPT